MNIIDLHCDTILSCYLNKNEKFRDGKLQISLEKMKETGARAQFFAVFLPTNAAAERRKLKLEPYELFNQVQEFFVSQLSENNDLIAPAFSAEDIEKNLKDKKMSAFLSIEDGVILDGRLDRITEVYDKGVRLITLTWNYENSLGYPNNDDAKLHSLGLKPFGIEAVKKMNELGIIIDVSHLSEGGFYDVAKHSSKPFTASHSCAKALCDHRRNLIDDQLKLLGETGSVVGVNFNAPFVERGSTHSAMENIIRHFIYIANKSGIEAVAMGSDFDGLDGTSEMEDYRSYEVLIDRLSKVFSLADLDKICHKNAERLLKECLRRS